MAHHLRQVSRHESRVFKRATCSSGAMAGPYGNGIQDVAHNQLVAAKDLQLAGDVRLKLTCSSEIEDYRTPPTSLIPKEKSSVRPRIAIASTINSFFMSLSPTSLNSLNRSHSSTTDKPTFSSTSQNHERRSHQSHQQSPRILRKTRPYNWRPSRDCSSQTTQHPSQPDTRASLPPSERVALSAKLATLFDSNKNATIN